MNGQLGRHGRFFIFFKVRRNFSLFVQSIEARQIDVSLVIRPQKPHVSIYVRTLIHTALHDFGKYCYYFCNWLWELELWKECIGYGCHRSPVGNVSVLRSIRWSTLLPSLRQWEAGWRVFVDSIALIDLQVETGWCQQKAFWNYI